MINKGSSSMLLEAIEDLGYKNIEYFPSTVAFGGNAVAFPFDMNGCYNRILIELVKDGMLPCASAKIYVYSCILGSNFPNGFLTGALHFKSKSIKYDETNMLKEFKAFIKKHFLSPEEMTVKDIIE